MQRVQSIEARALAGFFARGGALAEDLVDYFSEFDIVISYLYDPDEIFQANVGLCSQAQFIVGPHRPDNGQNLLHASEGLFEAAGAVGGVRRRSRAAAGGWAAVRDHRSDRPLAGGASRERQRKEELAGRVKWLELLRHLVQTTTLNLLLVGGEAERDRLARLEAALPGTRIKVMQSAPLPELAQWLASCVGFVGHDSGISHLAAAVGLPALILWGDSEEAIWRPRGRNMMVLRDANGLPGLSVAVVVNHLERLLNREAGG